MLDLTDYFNTERPVTMTYFEQALRNKHPDKVLMTESDYQELSRIYKQVHDITIEDFIATVTHNNIVIEVI